MAINDWLITERPREKLLAKGAGALSDAELLAILFRTGKKGKNAIELARELLMSFGGLRNLLEANFKELDKYPGVGLTKYVAIQAAFELARRQLQESLDRKNVLTCPLETKRYLASRLRHRQQEIFACLFLDNRNYVICYEELFFGTINSSVVHPREVIKKALMHNAAAIIIAHNHPSGIATPSLADKQITYELTTALNLVDIRVLDHIIIGDSDTVSFLEDNLL